MNKGNKGDTIMTSDFSTLYTTVLENKLLKVMHDLLDFCFDGKGNAYVAVTKYRGKWIPDPSKCYCYEVKWIPKTKRKELKTARKFVVFHFIHDLTA